MWEAIAGGMRIVRVGGAAGDGATTLLSVLRAGAPQHGFPDGVVMVADAGASAGDVAQRIAALLEPGAQPRAALEADIERLGHRAALILLDRAALTPAAERELAEWFPASCFVLADTGLDAAHAARLALGPLHPQSIAALLEASCGRRIDADNRRIALTICSSFASSPGRIRLVGAAMRVLDRSLISLYVHFGTGDGILDALVASLTPAEQSIAQVLAVARAPLAAHHIAYVLRRGDIGAALDKLVGCELIRTHGGDTYELPSYVAPYVPPAGDADGIRARVVSVLCDICDSATTVPVLDGQLSAAQALLACAGPEGTGRLALMLGPPLAAVYAARGEFSAWGHVLTLLESAARAAGETTLLNAVRHDLGVRALLVGSCADAAAHLASAARDRHAAGDDAGAAQSAPLAAIAGMFASAACPPARAERFAMPAAAAQQRSPASPAPRRSLLVPAAVAGAFAAVTLLAFATVSRRAADVPNSTVGFSTYPTAIAVDARGANVRPTIIAFSATPAHITAGRSTRLCYAVSGADLLRIVPRVGTLTRLRACETLVLREPRHYRYLLAATGDGGQTAMRQLQVDVAPAVAATKPLVKLARAAQLSPAVIYQFDATPSVVNSGQATSLCAGVERPARGFVTHLGALPPGITRCYRVEPRRTTVYRLYVALGNATTVQSVTVVVRPANRRTVALHRAR